MRFVCFILTAEASEIIHSHKGKLQLQESSFPFVEVNPVLEYHPFFLNMQIFQELGALI